MRPSTPTSPRRPASRPGAWRTTGLLSLLALGIASPLAVLALLGAGTAVGQTARLGLPPGAHDEGTAVAAAPAASTDATPALALRRGCHWGQPGRNPYRGSLRQALQAAGLPEDVIAQVEAQQRSGQSGGRLAISRQGIRHTGDGRVWPARGFALTFGLTLCQDATVNFAKGHVEMADLYEARDAQGRLHAVMVPDVCGNVSVLGAAASRPGRGGAVAGVSATLARRAKALAELADVLDPPATAAGLDEAAGQPTGRAPGDGPVTDRRDTARPAGSLQPQDGPADRAATGAAPAPVALTALALVADTLVPAPAAASVARGLSRISTATGRVLEAVVPGPGSGPGGGTGTVTAAGTAQPVPEPGSLSISLLGLALLAGWQHRRRRGTAPG